MTTHSLRSQSLHLRRRAPRRVVFTSWIVLCATLGVATAILVQPDNWYRNLAKPEWTPPEWVFPLVWLALYVMMGAAAARITRSRHPDAAIALSYFLVQLALNAAWLPAFFRSRALIVSMIAAVTLWLAMMATLWLFRQIDRRAALLFAPAVVWVTFALVLNFNIWRLN